MNYKCPSCGEEAEYETLDRKIGAVCKKCKRAVKMIPLAEKKEKEKVK